MYELCFFSNMTSTEWAAWAQVVGTIAAIAGAAWIAIWQSNKQHKNSLDLLRTEYQLGRIELARALYTLSSNCLNLLEYYISLIPDRESVHNIASGDGGHIDFNKLNVAEGAVHSIPWHSLPHQLVSLAMIVRSTVRQFRENIEFTLKSHRTMDSDDFQNFFSTLSEMRSSLKLTCDDIQIAISKLEQEA